MAAVAAMPGTRLRVERVEPDDGVRERWDALALASGNVFLSREWIEAWMRRLGGGGELFLYGAWRDDRLVALVPLHRERRHGVALVRFAGYEPADQPGVVCAPQDRTAGREALASALRRPELAWDVFVADRQPAGERCPLPARAVVRERYPVYRAELGERGWEGYLGSRSRKLRYRLRHDRRRLDGIGASYAFDLADPRRAIDELLELHGQRWGAASRFTGGPRLAFQREVLRLAAERGWLRIRRIELDGAAVASHCSFRYGADEHGYLSGRRSGFPGVGLGYMGYALALEDAAREGAAGYRCGFGGGNQKRQFGTSRSVVETVAYARTLRGRVAVAADLRRNRNLPGRGATAADPAEALR